MLFNTRSLLLATVAAVAVTVQAAPIASESSFLAARGLITEPMTEDLTFEARGLDADWSESDELYAREVLGDDQVDELIARGFGKFLKKAAKGAFHVATSILRRDLDESEATELYIRDLLNSNGEDADELAERGFGKFLKKAAKGAFHVATSILRRDVADESSEADASELYARDLIAAEDSETDELMARGFGKFLKKAAKGAFHVATSILRRDLDDETTNTVESGLYIRDLLADGSEDADELFARAMIGDEDEADALIARGFGKFLKKAAKGAFHVATSILRRDVVDDEADDSEMYIRDLLTSDAEEDNELLARHLLGDDEVDALVARGFGKKLWSGVKKAGRIGLTAASYL